MVLGVRGGGRVMVGAGLVLAVAAGGPAQAARPGAGDRVVQTISESQVVKVEFDAEDRPHARALRGRRAVVDRSSGATVQSASLPPVSLREPAAVAGGAGYSCVNNRGRRGFVAYRPRPVSSSTRARYIRFVYHQYKQNNARVLNRQEPAKRYVSKQLEVCSVGGAHSRGGNRLSRVVSMMTMYAGDRLIGQKWDSGREVSTAKATLGFSVPIRPVSISGSVDVHPTYTLTGSQGPDKQGPDAFDRYTRNQVNAIWEGSDTFRFQGSTHFQGNVGHGLWELPQRQRTPPIVFSQNHERFCGRLYGIGCA